MGIGLGHIRWFIEQINVGVINGVPMFWNWVLDWDTFIRHRPKIMGHHWQGTHELELGIGLGHIRWFIRKNDHNVPMYWNWVLDWVTFIRH